MYIVTPLIAAILPFILWPLEHILPYPAFIEEIAKVVIVFYSKKHSPEYNPLITGLSVGVLFALSEAVLYLFNFALVGNLTELLVRLALTIPLHTTSALIIAYSFKKGRKGLLLGTILAMALHQIYNIYITQFVALFS